MPKVHANSIASNSKYHCLLKLQNHNFVYVLLLWAKNVQLCRWNDIMNCGGRTERRGNTAMPGMLEASSGADLLRNGTTVSVAIALANIVFPHPGHPWRRTPRGSSTPNLAHRSGKASGHTIVSLITPNTLVTPPRSLNETVEGRNISGTSWWSLCNYSTLSRRARFWILVFKRFRSPSSGLSLLFSFEVLSTLGIGRTMLFRLFLKFSSVNLLFTWWLSNSGSARYIWAPTIL